MAKKYKVIALSVGGSNNKIYKSQDVVTEDNFPRGNAKELVAGGFLEELPDEDTTPVTDPSGEPEESVVKENGDGKITIEEISKKDIIKFLKAKNIQFETSDKKELFELYQANQ